MVLGWQIRKDPNSMSDKIKRKALKDMHGTGFLFFPDPGSSGFMGYQNKNPDFPYVISSCFGKFAALRLY